MNKVDTVDSFTAKSGDGISEQICSDSDVSNSLLADIGDDSSADDISDNLSACNSNDSDDTFPSFEVITISDDEIEHDTYSYSDI